MINRFDFNGKRSRVGGKVELLNVVLFFFFFWLNIWLKLQNSLTNHDNSRPKSFIAQILPFYLQRVED